MYYSACIFLPHLSRCHGIRLTKSFIIEKKKNTQNRCSMKMTWLRRYKDEKLSQGGKFTWCINVYYNLCMSYFIAIPYIHSQYNEREREIERERERERVIGRGITLERMRGLPMRNALPLLVKIHPVQAPSSSF